VPDLVCATPGGEECGDLPCLVLGILLRFLITPTTPDPNSPMLPTYASRKKQQPPRWVPAIWTPVVLMPLLNSAADLDQRLGWSTAQ